MAASIWSEVESARLSLADALSRLEPGQWDAESWCVGWRVRDVLGHLVHLAEATRWSMVRDIASNGGVPGTALARVGTRLGATPVEELLARLSAGASGRFHVPGSPPIVALGEVITHRADMLRPLGVVEDDNDPELVVAVLSVYLRLRRLAFHGKPLTGIGFRATDTEWGWGSGPEVRGRAVDLLALFANRHQALAYLSGPGLPALSRQ